MKKLFKPRSVAVIGASRDTTKVGHSVMKNMIDAGFKGKLHPVNPRASRILGKKVYQSVVTIPGSVDLAVIAVPAKFVPDVLASCGRKKIPYVVILSSGFKEMGPNGRRLEQALQKEAARHNIRILGPNCLGIVNTHAELNASFAGPIPTKGGVAFVSQSGAIGVSMIDWMRSNKVGMHSFVSLGNESDITELDVIEYLSSDSSVSVITVYLEMISDVARFMHVVSKAAVKKPIVIQHVGRSEQAKAAIQSHTGSLATSHAVMAGLIRQSGAIAVDSLEELFSVTLLLRSGYIEKKPLTIITNAGGPGVIATDLIDTFSLTLSKLNKQTKSKLEKKLPKAASTKNPIDILGDADAGRVMHAFTVVDRLDTHILLLLTPQSVTPIDAIVKKLVATRHKRKSLVIPCLIGGEQVAPALQQLTASGFASFSYPVQALKSLSYSDARTVTQAIPHAIVQPGTKNKRSTLMTYADSSKLLKKFKVALLPGRVLTTIEIPKNLSYPVAAKVLSQKAVHKKASGGVTVNIGSDRDLKKIVSRYLKKFKGKGFEGVLVQPMADPGLECILGAKRSSQFGIIVSLGIGGSFAEQINDISFRRWPIDKKTAVHMISDLSLKNVFNGFDVSYLAHLITVLGSILYTHPEIQEIDLNPVTVYAKGGSIIDTRFIKDA